MGDDLFSMVERFEIIVFFAGYTILYSVLNYLWQKPQPVIERLRQLLPYGYALAAVLFLGYFLQKIYLNHIMGNAELHWYHPLLIVWGLATLLFWVPVLAKKPSLSLVHSLVFFFFIIQGVARYFIGDADRLVLQNNMRILTTSLLINISSLAVVFLLSMLLKKIRKDH